MSNVRIRQATTDDLIGIFEAHRNSVERLCTSEYSDQQIRMWLDGRSPETYREAVEKGLLWLAGGALYLFLRGTRASSQGVYFARPPRALIERLDRLFQGKPEPKAEPAWEQGVLL